MITMRSVGYWSTGLSLVWRGGERPGWGGELEFFDDGFADDDPDNGKVSTQGSLKTRHFVLDGDHTQAITAVIDTLIADASRLGVTFQEPHLLYRGDGADDSWPPPPGWEATLAGQAARVGWKCPYTPLSHNPEG